MTENKIKKLLEETIEKVGDLVVYKYYDKWNFEVETEEDKEHEGEKKSRLVYVPKVRDEIYLHHFVEAMERKEGKVYEYIRVTATCREVIKTVTNPYFKPFEQDVFYEDTYDAYVAKWKELNPGKDWDEYVKESKRLRSLNRMHLWQMLSRAYEPSLFEYAELFRPVWKKFS